MENLLALAIAFLIGGIFSTLEVITIRYRKIASFISYSPFLYLHAIFFGVVSLAILYGLQNKMLGDVAVTQTAGAPVNGYIQAFIVGILTKSFLDIKIFSISSGEKSTPIGIKTITNFFEEPILSKIEADWFKNYNKFILLVDQTHAAKTKEQINNMVVDALATFPDRNRALIFLNGPFSQARDKREQFSLVMREFGKEVFCEIFQC